MRALAPAFECIPGQIYARRNLAYPAVFTAFKRFRRACPALCGTATPYLLRS